MSVSSGPYDSIKDAWAAERADILRAHLFRTVLEQGIFINSNRAAYGRHKPSLETVAKWTGYSVRTLKSWLQPPSSKTRRAMPLPALRHIILEYRLRDESPYDWLKLLRKAR